MRTRNFATTALLTGVLALTGGTVAHATDLPPTGTPTSSSNRPCGAEDSSLLHGVAARLTALTNYEEQCDDNSFTPSQTFGELTP
ncbi:hypothetical protein ABZ078_20010 [Streptomyces sp. NPDC006385]|uniref:hypothetical protein n=1 Tax=Streptomyces sp. NPDC006385 TaxID=3156761 RepID=UPI0033B76542